MKPTQLELIMLDTAAELLGKLQKLDEADIPDWISKEGFRKSCRDTQMSLWDITGAFKD